MPETSRSAFFVSDLHLGTPYEGARPDREAHFESWLRGLEGRADHLFLLGDIFEFWMEYRHYIPKNHFGVLAALHALRCSGTEIHYLCGNHDFNLGTFFRDKLGIRTHSGPFATELQGKRMLLLHGDGMLPRDRKYRMVRRVLHHPLANRAWKLLHPDLGMRIALKVGMLSRARHTVPDLRQYEAEARRLLAAGGHDILIHGHIHTGYVKRLPEGVYVNTGEWLTRLEYAEMSNGICSLKTYEPSGTTTA